MGIGATFMTGPMGEDDAMKDRMVGAVLIDVGGDAEFDRDLLERFGHPVIVCHGPAHGELCPLLAGTGCEEFNAAHGIVFKLDLDRPQHRAILIRYREFAREEVPIHVVCTQEQAARYAGELAAFEVWTHDPTVAELDGLAAEVEAADR